MNLSMKQKQNQGHMNRLVVAKGEGTGACVLVDEAGSCLSGGQDHFRW